MNQHNLPDISSLGTCDCFHGSIQRCPFCCEVQTKW